MKNILFIKFVHDLLINSSSLVYQKQNTNQLKT